MATRGRAPRKRSKSAGSAVGVRSHRRSPRGPNGGKPSVLVKGYKRGAPAGRRRKKRRSK